ncbi:GNAT family N-acetyltransferase [Rhizomonospora bruguierae]|uniref:GNAT family N-acetyltransferase n=1 Tax=Rhizomonospora bruguierae TaxID=1581705 RepID=UPI001BD18BFE|nr:GNAT family N-acetyltransferase [Micromonospora sp. NBRC 107566]
MESTVADNAAEQRFEIRVDGEVAGFAAYDRTGYGLALTHTEIGKAYEGKGLGSALVRGALDAARAEGLAVLPYCPFVRGWIGKHPEFLDLVPVDERARFDLPAA